MSIVDRLSDLERRIVAVLEEAGEDDTCTILNAIVRCVGSNSELTRLTGALRSLFDRGLLEFADTRDKTTLQWKVLSPQKTIERLDSLPSQLRWQTQVGLWQWNTDEARLTALLTQLGSQAAREVLKNFGWDMTKPA